MWPKFSFITQIYSRSDFILFLFFEIIFIFWLGNKYKTKHQP